MRTNRSLPLFVPVHQAITTEGMPVRDFELTNFSPCFVARIKALSAPSAFKVARSNAGEQNRRVIFRSVRAKLKTLRQWRRQEAAELALEKLGKGNRCAILKVWADDLNADWQARWRAINGNGGCR
jgi:hypothetical protein